LAAAICGALAQGGRWTPALDLFAQPATIYVALGAASALISTPVKGARRRGLVLGLLAALSGLALMANTPPVPAARPGAGDRPYLKVIQFNAWRGNAELPSAINWLASQKPDLVFIEEATPQLRDGLRARTGWHVAGRLSTVMIFSPHPLRAVNVRPTAHAAVEPTWVNAVVQDPRGEFEAIATHFTWPLYDLGAQQGPLLRRVIEQLPADTLVLGGDFNTTPWSFVRRRDDAALPVSRRDPVLMTWPVLLGGVAPSIAVLPIDHVYAGPNWDTVSVARGPRLGSDHLPVVVVLQRRAAPDAAESAPKPR